MKSDAWVWSSWSDPEAAPACGAWKGLEEPRPPVLTWAERVPCVTLRPATGQHWESAGNAHSRLGRIKTHHRPYNDIVSHISRKRTLQTTKNRGASILWANQSGVTLHLSSVLYLTGFILCPRVYIFKNPKEKRNISKCLLLESRGFLYLKTGTWSSIVAAAAKNTCIE